MLLARQVLLVRQVHLVRQVLQVLRVRLELQVLQVKTEILEVHLLSTNLILILQLTKIPEMVSLNLILLPKVQRSTY